jgi:hypothetical protein
MIGMNELMIILVVGGIIFFFGKDRVKEWLSLGKEISSETKTTKA